MEPGDTTHEPTGALIRRLAADVAALAHLYGAVVQEHYRGLSRDVARAALFVGAALALGVLALGLAVATIVLVVAIWLPHWAAALAVLAAVVAVGAILVLAGVRRLRRRQAMWAARVEEEVRWWRSLFPKES
jgi:hypothetical protein